MNRLYSEKEMLSEIIDFIESLGGKVYEVDMNRHIIDMEINPDLEETVLLYLEDILSLYTYKREELKKNNPFFGVEDMLENLKEDE
ncbi:MAG TPA: hypothetical protein VI911_06730 [Patescibacteria group bacterium]|nr:hypothetical protein [Patescibacteria group bacterium]